MIRCPRCWTENPLDSAFCEKCGMKLSTNEQYRKRISIDFNLIKGLLSLTGGCILLFLTYCYLSFFWDLLEIFVKISPSLLISQFHASFFYYTLKLIFFGGICVVLVWQGSYVCKKMKKGEFKIKKILWCTGLSLISASFLIVGVSIIILLIWNLGVQHEIVVQARERLLTTDPSDPSYYVYQYYSNLRETTIAGTLLFGGCAIGSILLGLSVLKKALKESRFIQEFRI